VPALPVVPDLDELEDGATRFRSRREEAVDQQFLRERGEETLDDRIVPAVADATHAGGEVRTGEQLLIRRARVLHAAIRMMHVRVRLAMRERHPQRGGCERVVEPRAQGQPTTRRDARSRITARYSQPSRVGMYVMSAAQTRSHAPKVGFVSSVKRRWSTFGAAGWAAFRRVVTRNFGVLFARMPASRMSRATRCLPHVMPCAVVSVCMRGLPLLAIGKRARTPGVIPGLPHLQHPVPLPVPQLRTPHHRRSRLPAVRQERGQSLLPACLPPLRRGRASW